MGVAVVKNAELQDFGNDAGEQNWSIICSQGRVILSKQWREISTFPVNQLPCLSGRWVPGIPRGLYCEQPSPR